jgi:hypothetical protein
MRKDELRAPNPSCAAQLFAADAFGRRPSASSASAVRLRSVLGDAKDVRSAPHFRGPESASYSTCTLGNEVLLPDFTTHSHGTVVF